MAPAEQHSTGLQWSVVFSLFGDLRKQRAGEPQYRIGYAAWATAE
jgi:hypothetical protein